MSQRDIRAGGAYVELMTKDATFTKGLSAAQQKLAAFTKAAALAGIALGAAAVGGIAASVKHFLSAGDAMSKMASRTGVSVEALSELQYAAERSGASLGEVEGALQAMRNKGLDPGQFDALATRIAAIENPAVRARAATEAFGGSGAKLLPMLGDLQALRQEARDLGLTMSGDAASGAARLGSMFSDLWKTVKAASFAIGAAVAPAIEAALVPIQRFATLGLKALQDFAPVVPGIIGSATQFVMDAWATVHDYVAPILGAMLAHATDVFATIQELVAGTWNFISSSTASVWPSITGIVSDALNWLQETVIGTFRAVNFTFNNFGLVASIALKSAQVSVVTFANEVTHLFGTVIPGWLAWFRDNWWDVFVDVVSMTETVARNIWKNLVGLWEGIKGLFNGEGLSGFTWTPLTEGFTSAIKELPKIAEREMGPLEKSLKADLDALAVELTKEWEDHGRKFEARAAEFTPASKVGAVTGAGNQSEDARRQILNATSSFGAGAIKQQIYGSFSAAALAAQGGVGGSDPTTKELRDMRKEQREQHREMVRVTKEQRRLR